MFRRAPAGALTTGIGFALYDDDRPSNPDVVCRPSAGQVSEASFATAAPGFTLRCATSGGALLGEASFGLVYAP